MEVSEFMEIYEFSFADRKLQSGPIAGQINILHNLIPTLEPKETIDLVFSQINGKNSVCRSVSRAACATPEHPQVPTSCSPPRSFDTLIVWIYDPMPGPYFSVLSHIKKLRVSTSNYAYHPEVTFLDESSGSSIPP